MKHEKRMQNILNRLNSTILQDYLEIFILMYVGSAQENVLAVIVDAELVKCIKKYWSISDSDRASLVK